MHPHDGRAGQPRAYDPRVSKHAAFLRGMNVGGHRITNDELRAEFEALGFSEVGLFRASGNVAFEAGDEGEAALNARIEDRLESALGYGVATFLRSDEEMRALAGQAPFDPAAIESSKGKLQVIFLSARPAKAARSEVSALASDGDRLEFSAGRELFWLPAGGTLESGLDLKLIDSLLGTSTHRTTGTVDQMAAKFF